MKAEGEGTYLCVGRGTASTLTKELCRVGNLVSALPSTDFKNYPEFRVNLPPHTPQTTHFVSFFFPIPLSEGF